MIAFICLFFPAVVSLLIYEVISKTKCNIKNIIYRYCLNNIIINLFVFGVKTYILGTGQNVMYTFASDMLPAVALNYLIISLPAAIILSVVEVLISKNVKVSVEENKDE